MASQGGPFMPHENDKRISWVFYESIILQGIITIFKIESSEDSWRNAGYCGIGFVIISGKTHGRIQDFHVGIQHISADDKNGKGKKCKM